MYENTDLARRFLLSDAPFSLLGYIQHCNETVWPLFSHLESAVREGTNQYEKAFGQKSKEVFQVVILEVQQGVDKMFSGVENVSLFRSFVLFVLTGCFIQQSNSQTEVHESHAQHC